jgi:hypothetical protein
MATWSGARVFHTNIDAHDPKRQPERNCAALAHARAPILVIRGLTLAHTAFPRHEIPQRFEDGVRNLVAVFQPDHPYFLSRNGQNTAQRQGVHFRSRIPHLTTRLTIVFWPPGRGYAWRAGPGNHTLSWELVRIYTSSLFSNLAAWLTQRQPEALTIVNAAALNRVNEMGELSPEMADAMRETVLGFFRSAVEERFTDEARRERALKSVDVVSMEDWLAGTDDWHDVFDENEVQPWLGDAAVEWTPRVRTHPLLGLHHIPQIPTPGHAVGHFPMFQLSVSQHS